MLLFTFVIIQFIYVSTPDISNLRSVECLKKLLPQKFNCLFISITKVDYVQRTQAVLNAFILPVVWKEYAGICGFL